MEYSTALEVIGGCFLAYHLINLLRRSVTGLRAFVLPLLGIKKNLKSFGSWAGTHTKSEVRKSTMQELTIFSVKKCFIKCPLLLWRISIATFACCIANLYQFYVLNDGKLNQLICAIATTGWPKSCSLRVSDSNVVFLFSVVVTGCTDGIGKSFVFEVCIQRKWASIWLKKEG